MPVIPRYDGPQISPNSLPSVQAVAPRDNGAIELARGLGKVSEVVQKAQDDADKVRVFEARNQLQNAVTDSLYGDKGVFNRKGRTAAGALPSWEQDFDKVSQEIAKNLSPRQRRLYDEAALQIRTPHREQVMRHEVQQLRAAQDAVYDSTIETTLNTVGMNYNDAAVRDGNIAVGEGALLAKLRDMGADGAVIENSRAAYLSAAHSKILDAAVAAGNLDFANSYLEQHSKVLVGDDARRVRDKIKGENDKVGGLAAAREAADKFPDDPVAQGDFLRDRFKDNPAALDYAQSEVKSIQAERAQFKKQQQDAALDTAMDAISQARMNGRVPTLRDIPRDTYDALDPEKKFSLQTTLDALAERAQRDAKERKNEAEKAQQQRLEAEASRLYWGLTFGGDLKNTNLAQYASTFMATDEGERKFADLVKTQQDLRSGKADKLTQIQTDSAMVTGYLKQLNIKDDDPQAIAAYDTFQRKVSALESQKGGKATPDEKRRLAQDMFIKREINTPWFSGGSDVEKAPFQMTDDEIGRIRTIDSVPSSERNAIRADYVEATGRQPTDAQVVEIYRAAIQQGR